MPQRRRRDETATLLLSWTLLPLLQMLCKRDCRDNVPVACHRKHRVAFA